MNHDMCVNIEEVEKVVETRAKLTESRIQNNQDVTNLKLDTQSEILKKVLEQTTKTNGRVGTLEQKSVIYDKHLLDTADHPNAIRKAEDWMLVKESGNKAIFKLGAVIGTIIGGVLALAQLIFLLTGVI